MEQLRGETSNEPIRRTMAFLRDAFIDYLAARVLFLADLPEQAAILSSTAIEKCAKAVIAWRGGIPEKTHLAPQHWTALRNEANFGDKLNGDFVELNQAAYKLRYTQDLPVGYSIVIASREFLAEMDHTILTILSCYQFHLKGTLRFTGYQSALAKSDHRLIDENHILTKQRVDAFIFSKPQAIYEMRHDAHLGVLEARYLTDRSPKRPGFLRRGLSRVGKQRDFDMSHFPIAGTASLVNNGLELIGREGSLGSS